MILTIEMLHTLWFLCRVWKESAEGHTSRSIRSSNSIPIESLFPLYLLGCILYMFSLLYDLSIIFWLSLYIHLCILNWFEQHTAIYTSIYVFSSFSPGSKAPCTLLIFLDTDHQCLTQSWDIWAGPLVYDLGHYNSCLWREYYWTFMIQ